MTWSAFLNHNIKQVFRQVGSDANKVVDNDQTGPMAYTHAMREIWKGGVSLDLTIDHISPSERILAAERM